MTIRYPARDNCRYCFRKFSEIGIFVSNSNRQVCDSNECRLKMQRESANKAKMKAGFYEEQAHRTQGRYTIPSNQTIVARENTESFFCFICHHAHPPDEIRGQSVKCACGALYTLSFGRSAEKVVIARVDRYR